MVCIGKGRGTFPDPYYNECDANMHELQCLREAMNNNVCGFDEACKSDLNNRINDRDTVLNSQNPKTKRKFCPSSFGVGQNANNSYCGDDYFYNGDTNTI